MTGAGVTEAISGLTGVPSIGFGVGLPVGVPGPINPNTYATMIGLPAPQPLPAPIPVPVRFPGAPSQPPPPPPPPYVPPPATPPVLTIPPVVTTPATPPASSLPAIDLTSAPLSYLNNPSLISPLIQQAMTAAPASSTLGTVLTVGQDVVQLLRTLGPLFLAKLTSGEQQAVSALFSSIAAGGPPSIPSSLAPQLSAAVSKAYLPQYQVGATPAIAATPIAAPSYIGGVSYSPAPSPEQSDFVGPPNPTPAQKQAAIQAYIEQQFGPAPTLGGVLQNILPTLEEIAAGGHGYLARQAFDNLPAPLQNLVRQIGQTLTKSIPPIAPQQAAPVMAAAPQSGGFFNRGASSRPRTTTTGYPYRSPEPQPAQPVYQPPAPPPPPPPPAPPPPAQPTTQFPAPQPAGEGDCTSPTSALGELARSLWNCPTFLQNLKDKLTVTQEPGKPPTLSFKEPVCLCCESEEDLRIYAATGGVQGNCVQTRGLTPEMLNGEA